MKKALLEKILNQENRIGDNEMIKIDTYIMQDVNKILADVYGEKFLKYREEWEKADNLEHVVPFPLHIDLETTGRCNLRCIMCNRTIDPNYKSNQGLSKKLIKRIIDEASQGGCYSLLYGNDDEPLLDAEKFLKTADYALSKGFCDVWLGTNGIKLTKQVSREIIKMKLPRLTISLDAATSETYNIIRNSDALNEIINNIETFLALRKEEKYKLPVIRVSYVVMKENKHETKMFYDMWQDKAEVIMFQSFLNLNAKLDDLSSEEKKDLFANGGFCSQPFKRIAIMGDGTVYPCCSIMVANSKEFSLGNIKNRKIEELWHSPQMNRLREAQKTGRFHEIDECLKCQIATYRNKKESALIG